MGKASIITGSDFLSKRYKIDLKVKVYLLYGQEEYQKQEALKKLLDGLLPNSGMRELNLEVFEGSETSADMAINSVNSLPFMGSRRIVIIKGVEALRQPEQRKLSKRLSKLADTACLIMLTREAAPTTSAKKHEDITLSEELINALKKEALFIHFPLLKKSYLKSWIRSKISEANKHIKPELIDKILERVENSLTAIDLELQKLINYIGDESEISEEAIEAIASTSVQQHIFQLTDAIGEKAPQQALKSLNKLMEAGMKPPYILKMIFNQLKYIWQAKYLLELGYLPNRLKAIPEEVLSELPESYNLVKHLREHYYWTEKFTAQANKFSYQQLSDALKHISKADLSIKGITKGTPKYALELLINNLCGAQEEAMEPPQ